MKLCKENSVCVVCGKLLGRVGKICDLCTVKLYLLSILTNKTLKEYAKEYNLNRKALSEKIRKLKERREYFLYLFEKAFKEIKSDLMDESR